MVLRDGHTASAAGGDDPYCTASERMQCQRGGIAVLSVKACNDLLGLWSDAYVLTEDARLVQNPGRRCGQIVIELDPRYYRRVDQLKARFSHGVPSLVACEKLVVEGDVLFGGDVVIKDIVRIINKSGRQMSIPDGRVLEGSVILE